MEHRLLLEENSPHTYILDSYQNYDNINNQSAELLLINVSETANVNNSLRMDHIGRNNSFFNDCDPYIQ